jgi:hypothetical protein
MKRTILILSSLFWSPRDSQWLIRIAAPLLTLAGTDGSVTACVLWGRMTLCLLEDLVEILPSTRSCANLRL